MFHAFLPGCWYGVRVVVVWSGDRVFTVWAVHQYACRQAKECVRAGQVSPWRQDRGREGDQLSARNSRYTIHALLRYTTRLSRPTGSRTPKEDSKQNANANGRYIRRATTQRSKEGREATLQSKARSKDRRGEGYFSRVAKGKGTKVYKKDLRLR